MALDNERFKRFERHIDNVNEVISAEDVNALGEMLEQEEKQRFALQDSDFSSKALFTMQNHVEANSLWLDEFADNSKLDTVKTELYLSPEDSSITFNLTDIEVTAWVYSKPYNIRDGANVQKFMLMVNEYKPTGSQIVYDISNNNVNWYPINANEGTLMTVPVGGTKICIRARMTRQKSTIFPRIDAWGVIFVNPRANQIDIDPGDDPVDPGVTPTVTVHHQDLLDIKPDDHHSMAHKHNGNDGSGTVSHKSLTDIGQDDHHSMIHHHGGLEGYNEKIDLATEVKGNLGIENMPLSLIFGIPGLNELDYNNAGRVIGVRGPEEDIYLVYDIAGNLDQAVTIKLGIASIETLIRTEGRLTGIDKRIKDAVEAEVQEIISRSRS